jgi:hypothetical protein
VVYSEVSAQEDHLGAAAAVLDESTGWADEPMGPLHDADPIGILDAIKIINNVALRHCRIPYTGEIRHYAQ